MFVLSGLLPFQLNHLDLVSCDIFASYMFVPLVDTNDHLTYLIVPPAGYIIFIMFTLSIFLFCFISSLHQKYFLWILFLLTFRYFSKSYKISASFERAEEVLVSDVRKEVILAFTYFFQFAIGFRNRWTP